VGCRRFSVGSSLRHPAPLDIIGSGQHHEGRLLRKLVQGVLEARAEPLRDAELSLEDPDTSVSVSITLELPDAAFQELLRLDPEEYEDEENAVILEWDDELGEWTAS
jgi:hypothetical protein